MSELKNAYNRCIRLLSIREHSQHELRQKMVNHQIDEKVITAVINRLFEEGYQSDERFAEVFCRSRISRKYGAQKIRYELQKKGIDDNIADQYIGQYDTEFLANAVQLIKRKIINSDQNVFDNFKLKNKVTRSLINKGYDFDIIRAAFELVKEEVNE